MVEGFFILRVRVAVVRGAGASHEGMRCSDSLGRRFHTLTPLRRSPMVRRTYTDSRI